MIKSIKNLSYEEMQDWAVGKNIKPFVGRQIFEWLFAKGADSTASMHNISKSVRVLIEKEGPLKLLEIDDKVKSSEDGSEKFLFRCTDGNVIESVLIPSKDRNTLCVSSQVGCAMACTFCRTAEMGIIRDLSSGEIVEQFILAGHLSEKRITHIVFMGMGEPFNNYYEVIKAAVTLNHEKGPNIAARRITLSTAGIIPRITEFAHLPYQFKLAISLNAATDEKRNDLMPLNRRYPLEKLLEAAKYFTDITNKHITFEYVLIRNVNDSRQDAEQLIRQLSSIPCKLNIIPYNETGGNFSRPDASGISDFISCFKDANFTVTLRNSGGQGISAACGQLFAREHSR